MRYALIFASSFFMVSVVALALLLSPDLMRDYQMRGKTLYHAKNYDFVDVSCRGAVQYIALCQLSVRQRQGRSGLKTFDYLIYGSIGRHTLKILTTKDGEVTTSLGRTHLRNRTITFSAATASLFLLMLICLIILRLPTQIRGSKGATKKPKYNYDQLRHLASHIVVPDNPVELWQNILQGTEMEWVVFQNGTLVLCEDDMQQPEHVAWGSLDRLSYPRPEREDSAPSIYVNQDYAVWIISYPGSSVLNYIKLSSTLDEDAALRMAKELCDMDTYEKRILYIERYSVKSYGY